MIYKFLLIFSFILISICASSQDNHFKPYEEKSYLYGWTGLQEGVNYEFYMMNSKDDNYINDDYCDEFDFLSENTGAVYESDFATIKILWRTGSSGNIYHLWFKVTNDYGCSNYRCLVIIPQINPNYNIIRAIDDYIITGIDISVLIPILKNDIITNLIIFDIIKYSEHGYITINNNDVIYKPDDNFIGIDSFVYIICDGFNKCDTAICQITVEDILVIPELFTPNGDGYNDLYVIKGLDKYSNNEIFIFNRWGNVVYNKENYNNSWDGVSNSKYRIGNRELPVGVYYYILKYNSRIRYGGLFLER